jgi:XRE family transcriptional regulator, fatty acid utilization regulator
MTHCVKALESWNFFAGLIATVAKRTMTPSAKPAPKKAAPRVADPPIDTQTQIFFGQRVRALREAAGMSQDDLAKIVGMAQAKFPAIEQGRRDVRLSTVRRFARALGVTLQDLLPPD